MKGMLMQSRLVGCLLLLGLVLSFAKANAQTDTDFWFVVPYTTNEHGGGKPALLTVSTYNMASTITISMPANSSFTPIVRTVDPNSASTFTLTDFIKNAANPSLENNGLNATIPNKCALYIKATTPITAYYNIANTNNTEIYALKGKNALGQKFYVPFQSVRNNHGFSTSDPAYSSINIVATEDNTTVTIKPTKNARVLGQSIAANTSKTITLEKGQSVSVMPELVSKKPGEAGNLHLGGTLVTSNKDVAITINDDSINNKSGENYDTLGDQIVNLESLGKTYVVLRTQASANSTTNPDANPINDNGEDIAYILATEDNTTVTIRNNEGSKVSTVILNAGQQTLAKTAGKYCIIESDKKVSVWHVGGFGGELGGAVLPAVDKCTGSTQVAFHKLQEGGKTFNTNIMVRTNGKDKFFLNGKPVNLEAASGGTWTQVGTSEWWFLQINNWNTGKFPSLLENKGNVLTNTGDLFHFGVFYGASSGGCNYGYFSDFNEMKIAGAVAGVDAGETKVCFGVPIQLYAQGGTTYKWTPGRYLSDSTIYNPIANVPNSGTQSYKVVVSGLCNMKDSTTINLQIYPPVSANFAIDKITGCSPLDVNFENTSINASLLEWQFGDGTDTISTDPTLVNKFSHRFINNTADSITYVVTLMVKGKSGCGDIMQKEITVYPSGEAKLSRDPDAQFCSPRAIVFHNESDIGAQDPANITYIWDYDDGYSQNVGTSTADSKHTFSSLGMPKLRHDVSLTMINNYGCKSVAVDTIDVYGKVEASFALDQVAICPGRDATVPNVSVTVTDNSTGMITSKSWGTSWAGWAGTPNVGLTLPSTPFTESKTYTGTTSEETDLTLTVTGSGGCTDTFTKKLTVYPYVKADFALGSVASICDGDVVNITNNSSLGSTSFEWDYGDGISSIDSSSVTAATKNSSHTYENPTSAKKTYLIKLAAKSTEGGCVDSIKRSVTVYSRIFPKFTMNTPQGCAPILSTITNASEGNAANTYKWYSGEGDATTATVTYNAFSTDKNPVAQSFVNTSTAIKDYTVKLEVTNEGGCAEEVTRLVRVYPQPTSNFKADVEEGCNPLPVKFTIENPASVATYDYFWSFGDGATSDKTTGISHEFSNFDATSDNVFSTSLEVSNIYGCSSIFTKNISVHPYLKSAFTLEQTNCTPVDVTITPAAQGATAYNWTLSGGTVVSGDATDGNPFTVRYENNGTTDLAPTISLVATNAGGTCSATSSTATVTVLPKLVADATFTVDKCSGKAEFTNASTGYSQYEWDFGDGETSSATTTPLVHNYLNRSAALKNFNATLTVKNKVGCVADKKLSVGVAPVVESSFTFDVIEKCTPVKLNLTNTSLNGTDFFWSYDGGAADETRTTKTPFETIISNIDPNSPKTYTISLRALDKNTTCESTSSQLVTVQPLVVAALDYVVADKCTGAINFTNKSTGGSSYTWTYGDATSAYTTTILEGVSHTYLNRSATNQTFTAKLAVTNALGCTNEATKLIGIVPRVESHFTLDVKEKCTPMVVMLTNTSLNGTTFDWDYGHTIGGVAQKETKTDKAVFDLTVDSESPNAIQTYPISLRTTDAATGCTDISTTDLEVYPRVVAAMSHTVTDKCSGAIDFKNTSTGAIAYTWEYNDGTSAFETTTPVGVSHVFLNRDATPKTFIPTLTAVNALGCTNVMTENVNIVPRVEASFTLDVIEKCTPVKLNLTNTSLNGTEYYWSYDGGATDEMRSTTLPFEATLDNLDPDNQKVYRISLRTLDSGTSCESTSSQVVTVLPKVIAAMKYTVTDLCSGAIDFTNHSTGGVSYTWKYGDETSSYTTNLPEGVKHIYLNREKANKYYTATLSVNNAIGCSNENTQIIEIVPRVESHFTLDVKEKCTPMVVTLTNTSLNGTTYAWDYGHTIGGVAQKDTKTDKAAFDLTVDSESANSIQTYPITLVTTDAATLCTSTSSTNLEVYPKVLPKFQPSTTEGCSDLLVTLTNESTGGDMSYAWAFGDGETAGTKDLATTVSHTYQNRTELTKKYTASLLATNALGCKAEYTQVISAYPKVEAGFSFTQNSKCTPFPIDIKNSSLNGNTFSWDFGHKVGGVDKDTVTVNHDGFRTYIYNDDPNNAQTYTITLSAASNEGCTSTVTKTISANPVVISNFSLDIDRGCNPLSVSFDNLSTGASTYSWNLGNGNSSSIKVPATMLYSNIDTVNTKQYDVVLTAKNADGCFSTTTKKIFVYPKIMADFNIDKSQGCTPFLVNISNAYPSSAYNYEWDLGSNGQHTMSQLPAQTFVNLTPDYTVKDENIKLKVFYKNDATCFKEVSKTINVYPRTRSDFKMDVTEACNPLVVNFTNTSESFSDKTTYNWKFATLGTASVKDPQYMFTNMSHTDNATYSIQLKSTSVHGCTDSISRSVLVRPVPKASIEIKTTTACAPFNVDIQNHSIGALPTYSYWLAENPTNVVKKNDATNAGFTIDNLTNDTKASVVWHKIVSDFGCADSISQVVYTYPYVTANFDFSPEDKGCNPLSVNFKNQSKNADYYLWDFDDGISTSVADPMYIFHNLTASDRIFNVKLTARSIYGCQSSYTKDFTVYPAPMAYFTIDPQLRTYPDASFLMENKTTPMAPTWTYEWDFGDGKSYTGVTPPVHVYDTWAPESEDYKYYVTLKVNNGNCSDELKQYLFLKPAVPIAIFDSSVGESCAPLVTQFSHEAVYYNSIEWDFGDGTTSTEDSPVHEYPIPGRYYVQLTVRGDGGVTYAYKTLYVHPNPSASFKFAPEEAMLPEAEVHFYNTSTEGKTFYWDFGDHLGSSTEQNPVYKYKDLGVYDVRLTVTSENGCVDDTLLTNQVKVIGEGLLKFPNAFIPSTAGGNGGYYETPDYKNEVFHPIYAGVVTYKMLIYNRWGERLFESNDPTIGWDGYYKGKLCEQGVYVYRAQGRYTNGKTFDIRGDVTLLR